MRSAAAVASAVPAPDASADGGASKLAKAMFEKGKGKKEKGKNQDKSKDEGVVVDEVMGVPCGPAQPRRRRRRDRAAPVVAPSAAPAVLADAELDDAWADEGAAVRVAVVPPRPGVAADGHLPLPRRSGSRSPRRPPPDQSDARIAAEATVSEEMDKVEAEAEAAGVTEADRDRDRDRGVTLVEALRRVQRGVTKADFDSLIAVLNVSRRPLVSASPPGSSQLA
jgi:hypothetical protein